MAKSSAIGRLTIATIQFMLLKALLCTAPIHIDFFFLNIVAHSICLAESCPNCDLPIVIVCDNNYFVDNCKHKRYVERTPLTFADSNYHIFIVWCRQWGLPSVVRAFELNYYGIFGGCSSSLQHCVPFKLLSRSTMCIRLMKMNLFMNALRTLLLLFNITESLTKITP